jgi:tRNA(fMet)-specific endonuclease VapC
MAMNCVVVDANVLIDVINGRGDYAVILGKAAKVLVPLIVLGEIHAGFSNTHADRAKRRAVENFLNIPSVETITLSEETVGFYAAIRRQLKQAGTPIPQNDVWIAAQTLEHGAVLCTRDDDFKAVANLRLVPEN